MPPDIFPRLLDRLSPVSRHSPLWPLARRYAWTIPAVAGLGFLSSLLEGIGINLLIPLLGTLLQSASVSLPGPLAALDGLFAQLAPADRLQVIAVAIFAFVIAKVVVQAGNATLIAWVDGHVSDDVRRGLAGSLLGVGYPFFLNTRFARLLNIISVDSWRASDAIRMAFNVVSSAAACVVFVGLLMLIDWQLTLLVGVGVGLIRGLHLVFMRRATRLSVAVTDTNTVLGELMLHCIQGMRLIRIFGQQQRELRAFTAASVEVKQSMFAVARLSALAGGVNEAANAALFIAILLGAYFAGVGLPSLATFLVLLYRFQPFLRNLSTARLGLASTRASVDGVEWLLDPADKPPAPVGDLPVEGLHADIVFERVDFQYAEGRAAPALQQASFTLVRGRTTALIGDSGSGKSTVVNLICRLLEPTAGRILVGDRDLGRVDPAAWRARIGFAGQDADLIEGTVAANIRYGAPEATAAEIEAAATLVQMHDFIRALPQGYDTPVGARGTALSGGQRQRIGLARALVRRPELLILDEATNALDAASEATILAQLALCAWQPTVIVVSHRASTVAACQDGIVFDQGRVVDAGRIDRLVAQAGPAVALRALHG